MTQKTDKKEPQAEKFKRLAREVGAGDDERAFEDKLRRVARQKPTDQDDKPKDK